MEAQKEQGSTFFSATVVVIVLSLVLAVAFYLPSFVIIFNYNSFLTVLGIVAVLLYTNIKVLLLADGIAVKKQYSRYYRSGIMYAISTSIILVYINAPAQLINWDLISFSCMLGVCFLSILAVILFLLLLRAKQYLSFLVSISIFVLHTIAFFVFQNLTDYFLVYLIVIGMSAVFNSFKQALLYFFCSNFIILALFLSSFFLSGFLPPMGMKYLLGWGLSGYVSILILMLSKFAAEKKHLADNAEVTMNSLMSATPNLIVLLDNLNRISYISKPLAELVHIEEHELTIGRPIVDLFPEMEMKLMISEIISSDGFFSKTIEMVQQNKVRHFRVLSDRFLGEAQGRFIDISDVTQIMEAKLEAEKSNAAKSIFLAKMSHEIRTPMNAIIGMTDIILRDELPPGARENAMEVKQAGKSLISIINDILDISKIESGKMDICNEPYDFASLIKDTVDITRLKAAKKGLMYTFNVSSHMPVDLIGDEIRLRQILINIINNAIKYTKVGHISLDVEYKINEDNTLWIFFKVTDTGVGIKQEDLKLLFNEFSQLDHSKNWRIEGTGLGLSIAKNLAVLMGGDINVYSTYGMGSTFFIKVKQELASLKPLATVLEPGTIKILVLEARQFYRDSVINVLNDLRVPFVFASTIEEFDKHLSCDSYSFVMVGNNFILEAKKILQERKSQAMLLALNEMGISSDGVTSLTLPMLPSTLANIFNKIEEVDEDDTTGGGNVKFVSPRSEILVVDDIATNLKVIDGLLEPYKFQLSLCKSGKDALRFAKEQHFDLIFMDHMMPDMDGIEVTGIMRNMKDSYLSTVPIIALTANAIHGMSEVFLKSGFNDFLAKPINLKRLDDLLDKWIPHEKKEFVPISKGLKCQANFHGPRKHPIASENGKISKAEKQSGFRTLADMYSQARKCLEFFYLAPKEDDLLDFIKAAIKLRNILDYIGQQGASEKVDILMQYANKHSLEEISILLPLIRKELTTIFENVGKTYKFENFNNRNIDQEVFSTSDWKSLLIDVRDLLMQKEFTKAGARLDAVEEGTIDDDATNQLNNILYHINAFEVEKAIVLIDDFLEEKINELF
ncbi:MAG: response regulator [Deltaproteobacteria bacterium]|jgi:signal transduction histidine kinase/DNA-binding NarL/FixJ family response regulator|nr:response regulator [Deltaproteobacteria bacterium]